MKASRRFHCGLHDVVEPCVHGFLEEVACHFVGMSCRIVAWSELTSEAKMECLVSPTSARVLRYIDPPPTKAPSDQRKLRCDCSSKSDCAVRTRSTCVGVAAWTHTLPITIQSNEFLRKCWVVVTGAPLFTSPFALQGITFFQLKVTALVSGKCPIQEMLCEKDVNKCEYLY